MRYSVCLLDRKDDGGMVIDGQLLCVHSRTRAGGGCSGASLCVHSRTEAGGGRNRACPACRALCVCSPERKQEAGTDVHALHLLPATVWAPLSSSTAPTPTSTQVSGPDLGPDDVPIIAPLLAGPRFCVLSPCGSVSMQLCSLAPLRFRVLAVPHLGSSVFWQFCGSYRGCGSLEANREALSGAWQRDLGGHARTGLGWRSTRLFGSSPHGGSPAILQGRSPLLPKFHTNFLMLHGVFHTSCKYLRLQAPLIQTRRLCLCSARASPI